MRKPRQATGALKCIRRESEISHHASSTGSVVGELHLCIAPYPLPDSSNIGNSLEPWMMEAQRIRHFPKYERWAVARIIYVYALASKGLSIVVIVFHLNAGFDGVGIAFNKGLA